MGVNRLALTDADRDGRRLVKRWFEEAGLEVRVDRIGNVYGRRRGEDPSLAPVISGSHIDSVPTGGAFDGALGVLGALEVRRSRSPRARRVRRAPRAKKPGKLRHLKELAFRAAIDGIAREAGITYGIIRGRNRVRLLGSARGRRALDVG